MMSVDGERSKWEHFFLNHATKKRNCLQSRRTKPLRLLTPSAMKGYLGGAKERTGRAASWHQTRHSLLLHPTHPRLPHSHSQSYINPTQTLSSRSLALPKTHKQTCPTFHSQYLSTSAHLCTDSQHPLIQNGPCQHSVRMTTALPRLDKDAE